MLKAVVYNIRKDMYTVGNQLSGAVALSLAADFKLPIISCDILRVQLRAFVGISHSLI